MPADRIHCKIVATDVHFRRVVSCGACRRSYHAEHASQQHVPRSRERSTDFLSTSVYAGLFAKHPSRLVLDVVSAATSASIAHAHLDIPAAALASVLLNLHILHVLLADTALGANPLDVLAASLEQELHDIALVRALGFEHGQVAGLVLCPHVGAGADELLHDGQVAVERGPVQGRAALGVLSVEGGGGGEVFGEDGEEVC